MRRSTLFLLVITPAVATAQGPPAWKFATGDIFVLHRHSQSEQVMTVKERPFKQTVERISVFRFEVAEIGADRVTLKSRIETMQVQHLAGKAALENKLQEKMRGAAFTLQITRQGRVKNLTGYDELVAQVADKKEDLARVVRQLWPADLLRQEFKEMLAVVPERTVAVGERWEETGTLLVPPLGSFAIKRTKVYAENDRAGHAHLLATITGEYQPPMMAAELFRVVKGDLRLGQARWECVFDREQGRPMRIRQQFELQGPLTIEVMGMLTSADLAARVEVTTKLLPQQP